MPTMITRFVARVQAWLIASAIAYLCASVLHSQTVLAGLSALSVPISASERLSMTLGDLVGLRLYALVIAIGLALALPVLNLAPLRRRLPSPAARGAIAGALAMAVILTLPSTRRSAPAIVSRTEPSSASALDNRSMIACASRVAFTRPRSRSNRVVFNRVSVCVSRRTMVVSSTPSARAAPLTLPARYSASTIR